jgi:hypothetical protein
MPDQIHAPDFDAALGWLNTDRPSHVSQEPRANMQRPTDKPWIATAVFVYCEEGQVGVCVPVARTSGVQVSFGGESSILCCSTDASHSK